MKRNPTYGRRFVLNAGLGLLALHALLPNSRAQTSTTPAQGRPLLSMPKPVITMDEKVATANHIFVGTGRRIYFVDNQFREVQYENAARIPQSLTRFAMLEIDVERTLFQNMGQSPGVALLFTSISKEPFGGQASSYEQLARKFVNRSQLFFGLVQTDQIRIEVPNEPSKVVGEITLHRFVPSYAIEGPIDNPLPLSYLDEAVAAANRRIEREKSSGR